MYGCIKCDFVTYEKPKKLICPRCTSELRERAYYMNGDVYQGEKYATIQLMLFQSSFQTTKEDE